MPRSNEHAEQHPAILREWTIFMGKVPQKVGGKSRKSTANSNVSAMFVYFSAGTDLANFRSWTGAP
jgi:hypothetical protein